MLYFILLTNTRAFCYTKYALPGVGGKNKWKKTVLSANVAYQSFAKQPLQVI